MQKQKGQVRQPVTMAVLIATLLLSELPSYALINSTSPSAIPGKRVSTVVTETTGNTDDRLQSNFVILPIHGNIYPDGFYSVRIKIGDPPEFYLLDIDTGSELTWLPKVPNRRLFVPCNDPRCTAVHESTGTNGKCKNSEPCDYEINYYDQTSSKGYMVTDTVTLLLIDGFLVSPSVAIGYKAHHSSTEPSTTHGMLGLGKGQISILSQLREQRHFDNIFGHCLSNNPNVPGFLFIGNYLSYPGCLTWVPMSSPDRQMYSVDSYSVTVAEVVYGDEQLLGRNQAFILDTGTTHTYFLDPLYQSFLFEVRKSRLQYVPGDEKDPPCWKVPKRFNSIHHLRDYFSTVKLKFTTGLALEIPPENYFIITVSMTYFA